MRIAFICGALEPGCDGVGDYTRRLAGELIRQGNGASILALNDMFIDNVINETHRYEEITIDVLRIPSKLSNKCRFLSIKRWIADFDPTWISLQFVPHSFHPKGIPYNLVTTLVTLGSGRQWHIMFHELWLIGTKRKNLKGFLLSGIQQMIIKKLLETLKPKVIHTQSKLFQSVLNKKGISSNYLPLFSNIPVASTKVLDKVQPKERKRLIRFIHFGCIHDNSRFASFAQEATVYAKQNNVRLMLTLIGRNDNMGKHWARIWESLGLKAILIGESTTENISNFLSKAHFGISSTPYALIEKSGSVAAMKAHGLPVICISNKWKHERYMPENIPGVAEYEEGNFEYCISHRNGSKTNATVFSVASKMAYDLKQE